MKLNHSLHELVKPLIYTATNCTEILLKLLFGNYVDTNHVSNEIGILICNTSYPVASTTHSVGYSGRLRAVQPGLVPGKEYSSSIIGHVHTSFGAHACLL